MHVSPEVYAELRRLAAACLRRERRDHTHQATSLANEAVVRVGARAEGLDAVDLIRLASRAMRQVLVDHARRRLAVKRGGGGQRVALEPDVAVDRRTPESIVSLHESLGRLERDDPGLAEIVELRCFGGLSEAEAAAHLGVSLRTMSRRWRLARMYLARDLGMAQP